MNGFKKTYFHLFIDVEYLLADTQFLVILETANCTIKCEVGTEYFEFLKLKIYNTYNKLRSFRTRATIN